MVRSLLCSFLVLFFPPVPAAAQDVAAGGEPLELVLEPDAPALLEVGPGRVLRYEAQRTGVVFAYATGDPDLVLRVQTTDGRGQTDDDSGGGTTPYARLIVNAGTAVEVIVAAKRLDQPATVRLVVDEAAETPETKEVARVARERLVLAQERFELGDLGAARHLLERNHAELRDVPDGDRSPAMTKARSFTGQLANDVGHYELATAMLAPITAYYERALPPDHRSLQKGRKVYGIALMGAGRHEEAFEVLNAALNVFARTLPLTDPRIGEVGALLAECFRVQGRHDDEVPLRRRLLEWREARGEDADPAGLADDRARLGEALYLKGELVGARTRLEKALGEMRELGLQDTPRAGEVLWFLGRTRLAQGDVEGFTQVARTLIGHTSAHLERAAGEGPARAASLVTARAGCFLDAALSAHRLITASGAQVETPLSNPMALTLVERARCASLAAAGAITREELEAMPGALVSSLREDEKAVAYWRYGRWVIAPGEEDRVVPHYLALVVGPKGAVRRVELGEAEAVDAAVGRWTRALGGGAGEERAAGEALRRLVFDPLELVPGTRVRFAAAGALELAPFFALPLPDGGRLEQRFGLQRVPSLVPRRTGPPIPGRGVVVVRNLARTVSAGAAGGREPFASRGFFASTSYVDLPERAAPVGLASTPRDSVVVAGGAGDAAHVRLACAERRRVHLAVTRWSARPGTPAADDERDPLLAARAVLDADPRRRFSPAAMTGLCFAGWGLDPGSLGELPALLTAEQLLAFDLARADLVVLVCQTPPAEEGELAHRAWADVAELRRALHGAGAKHVLLAAFPARNQAPMVPLGRLYEALETGPAELLAEWRAGLAERRDPRAEGPLFAPGDGAAWVLSSWP